MNNLLKITKALSDESRLRALALLGHGELCLCQIIELLALAPSTVSKHMQLLSDAGLVEYRKEGRWRFYRLARPTASPDARAAIRWVKRALAGNARAAADAQKLKEVLSQDKLELTSCYRS